MCVAQGGIIQPLHVHCSAGRAVLLPDNHHPVHPQRGLVGRDLLQYAQLHIPGQLLLDLLHPVNRDGGRVVDSMGNGVRFEGEL